MLSLRKSGPIKLRDFTVKGLSAKDIATRSVTGLKEGDRFESALKMVISGYRIIPVMDSDGKKLTGFIGSREVLDFLGAGPLSGKAKGKLINSSINHMGRRVSIPVGEGDDVSRVLDSFRENDVNLHHVENKSGLVGIITKSDITYRIRGRTGLKVRDVMTKQPFHVRDEEAVSDVARMLARGPFRKLPVVRDGFLVGIVTPYDIISYLNRNQKLSKISEDRTIVRHAMNAMVASVRPDADVADAVAIMRRKNVSGLPVTDEDTLVGIITERDIIEAMR